jgi:tetratricopeptide (TPR) repeat protein
LEQKANQKIEDELTLRSEKEIEQANELMDSGQPDAAEIILKEYLAKNPDSADACNLLLHIYQQQQHDAPRVEILGKLSGIYAKAGENELAWSSYEEFLNTGGKKLTADAWIGVCRAAEKLQRFDRAVAEYEKVVSAYPSDRQSIVAQIAAGRVYLKQLNQPEKALRLFQAADASQVPHLDWEQSIATGIREAKAALPGNSRSRAASAGQA